ncbi:hypothetical protein [Burkholderia ambifaria]|uniref:Putative signal peptide protein n=1 Tax=Burkholderia ambifaria MEX-5 TaxID=396597 RepID=B1T827_9BURK|nr:hypothetical protein [Burkholderia ambifaria]EDT40281.1 putative signal peptide protein [Burkholderia ambifaria MEX-5]
MSKRDRNPASAALRRNACTLTILAACCLACVGLSAQPSDDAATLRAQYQNLKPQLDRNSFHRRLYLDSQESFSTATGEIYAEVDYPFATVSDVLDYRSKGLANWCELLILHPNVKYCRASGTNSDNMLTLNISKREAAAELQATYRLYFRYDAAARAPGYFKVRLHADSGPLNTRDYQIVLEAVQLGDDHTFLHLTYAFSYGLVGRLAMKSFLATFDHGKVGFTNVASPSAAQAEYVDGVRGLVERNTMRYYLAIDAYLAALLSPPDKQLEQRLSTWFNSSEQYARQLHEIDRQQYMRMKQDEYRRQQTE